MRALPKYLIAITLLWAARGLACTLPGDGWPGHGTPLSYTDYGDGTIRDNVTGLIWEKTPSVGNQVPFAIALAYPPTLDGLGGRAGWRLPSLKELESIANYSMRWPAINQTIFGPAGFNASVPDVDYWTMGGRWNVDFNGGGIQQLQTNYVRAVWGISSRCFPGDGDGNGGPLGYRDNGNGTVTDLVTGLMWEQTTGVIGTMTSNPPITDVNRTYTWDTAQSVFIPQINAARVGGYSDWRLPNIRELLSIEDYGLSQPNPVDVFGPTNGWYWSSTQHAGAIPPTCAWGVGGGQVYHNDRPTRHFVRAVRLTSTGR